MFRISYFFGFRYSDLVLKVPALRGVVHCGVERNCTAAAHLADAAFFGVEVVVAGGTGDYLALFGDTEALCIRFVGFHSLN